MAKVESKEYGTVIGKRRPVFNYTGNKNFTIDPYKKDILNKFAIIRKLTSSSSPWVKKIKTDKIWLCESAFHRGNFLSLNVKKGDTNRFL